MVRGATAIYGDRAAGGVVNIITKNPQTGVPHFSTALGVDTSLSHANGSLGGYARQSFSGVKKWFDYSFAGAFHRTGGAFDAEGERIPPDPFGQGGLADSGAQDVFAKLGFRWGQQQLRPSVNYYRMKQDSEYAFDPSVNLFAPGTVKARTRHGLVMDDPRGPEMSCTTWTIPTTGYSGAAFIVRPITAPTGRCSGRSTGEVSRSGAPAPTVVAGIVPFRCAR